MFDLILQTNQLKWREKKGRTIANAVSILILSFSLFDLDELLMTLRRKKMQKMVSCYAYDQVTVDLFSFLDCNPISNHVKLL